METTRFDEENQAFLTANCGRLQVPFTSPHSLSVNGSSGVAPGETIRSQSIVLRHKVANTPWITPMAITEYRSCTLFAVILGRTQNLHFAVNGWFMQRRSHIYISEVFSLDTFSSILLLKILTLKNFITIIIIIIIIIIINK